MRTTLRQGVLLFFVAVGFLAYQVTRPFRWLCALLYVRKAAVQQAKLERAVRVLQQHTRGESLRKSVALEALMAPDCSFYDDVEGDYDPAEEGVGIFHGNVFSSNGGDGERLVRIEQALKTLAGEEWE